MRSPLGSQRPASRDKEWKVLLCFVVLLLFLGISSLRTPVRSVASTLISPLWKFGTTVEEGIMRTFSGFFSAVRLAEENAMLREEIASLRAQFWRNEVIREERDALRGYMNHASSTEYIVLAYVLAAPNRAPYDTLLLDVGADAGLSVGAQVFTDGGFAIGVIRDVFSTRSVAELYSSPGVSQDVLIGSSRIPSVAHGIGGGNYRIELPKNTDIAEGDAVVFAGTTERFLGVIERIIVNEKTGITTLFLRLPVNMTELRSVIVDLAPPGEPLPSP